MAAGATAVLPSWLAPSLAPWFRVGAVVVTPLEAVAIVLSLAMVVGNIRERVWAWPLAIASSALYALLFAASRLYGAAALQLAFVAIALWGWWQWWRGAAPSSGAALAPTRLDVTGRAVAVGAVAVLAVAIGLLLRRATDAAAPWSDALLTAGSLVAQALLARKRLETWPLWLVVNVAYVALFAQQGLAPTAALYVLFAALSVVGWRAWSRAAAID